MIDPFTTFLQGHSFGMTHDMATALASFSASLVECVEALTIVLAVGVTRGWRSSLSGAGLGMVSLLILLALFAPLLAHLPFPLSRLQFVLGLLLLAFGMRWLKKAILRAAGRMPLRDEEKIYEREVSVLKSMDHQVLAFDVIACVVSFKAVFIEGIEVVFIVLALGASEATYQSSILGAASALLVVAILGFALHRPLKRIPENSLKFGVGVMLSSFGVYWIGEGLGVSWPGQDLILLAFIVSFFVISISAVYCLKIGARIPPR